MDVIVTFTTQNEFTRQEVTEAATLMGDVFRHVVKRGGINHREVDPIIKGDILAVLKRHQTSDLCPKTVSLFFSKSPVFGTTQDSERSTTIS